MNFFKSLFIEGTPVSHKRWISLTASAIICYGVFVVIHNHPTLIQEVLRDTMIFVSIMSGVATIPQIISIWKNVKGDNSPNPESTEETKSETLKTE